MKVIESSKLLICFPKDSELTWKIPYCFLSVASHYLKHYFSFQFNISFTCAYVHAKLKNVNPECAIYKNHFVSLSLSLSFA